MTDRRPDAAQTTRIFFVNRFYAPDMSATSQILSATAESLAAEGHDVTVYSSRMSYGGDAHYSKKERLNGVSVRRIWSTRFGRGSTLGRSFDYLTFYLSICWVLLFSLTRDDILVAKTDPPILSVPLGVVARIKRAKLVNWLQDVFPEVALNLGVGSRDGFLMRALKRFRDRSLIRAHANIVIGTHMAKQVEQFGVPADRIAIIQNFVDDDAITPIEDHAAQLRDEWEIAQTDFVIGYSGNLGRAHDLDTILDVASALEAHRDIKFLFVGSGFLHTQLTEQITARKLSNIVLKPYQPQSRLRESLGLPNLHWASLQPSLEGFIFPSKLYGIAAAGRPLLMIGDTDGEIGQLIAEHKFGLCVQPGDSDRAKGFILDSLNAPDQVSDMGQRARQFLDQYASRAHAMSAWKRLVTQSQ